MKTTIQTVLNRKVQLNRDVFYSATREFKNLNNEPHKILDAIATKYEELILKSNHNHKILNDINSFLEDSNDYYENLNVLIASLNKSNVHTCRIFQRFIDQYYKGQNKYDEKDVTLNHSNCHKLHWYYTIFNYKMLHENELNKYANSSDDSSSSAVSVFATAIAVAMPIFVIYRQCKKPTNFLKSFELITKNNAQEVAKQEMIIALQEVIKSKISSLVEEFLKSNTSTLVEESLKSKNTSTLVEEFLKSKNTSALAEFTEEKMISLEEKGDIESNQKTLSTNVSSQKNTAELDNSTLYFYEDL